MIFKSLVQIDSYLIKQDNRRRDTYTLARIQEAVKRLDNPQLRYQVIHVGGTSGKGSTCQMIYAILQAAHKRVGIFTSPHLVNSLERIVVNNKPITEAAFIRLVNSVWPIIADLNLTYFEFYTLLALYYFAKQHVKYAVIEVGVGGRLDATNVITPTVALVTDIGLDHTELLGNTKRAIAKEKAAIIKPGCIGLTGSRQVRRGKYIDLAAAKMHEQTLVGTKFDYKQYKTIFLNLVGDYQVRNAILAIETAQALRLPRAAIYQGLTQVKSVGRFQVLSKQPLIIIDGAHNPQKMKAFVKSLQQLVQFYQFEQVKLLFALKYTKDAVATLRPLVKHTDTIILTTFKQSMSLLKLKRVVKQLNPNSQIIVQRDSKKAYRVFRKQLHHNDLGIVTGSLYLIGELLPLLNPSLTQGRSWRRGKNVL